MPNIQLTTGKTIYVSAFEYYFKLEDKDIEIFFQSCVADDLGTFTEDPFSQRAIQGRLDVEEIPDIEEAPIEEKYE